MPKCKYCGEEYSASVLPLHENWCRPQHEENVPQDPVINITDQNANSAIELVENCQDVEQITAWLAEESQGKNRKTVIEALEAKKAELEGDK